MKKTAFYATLWFVLIVIKKEKTDKIPSAHVCSRPNTIGQGSLIQWIHEGDSNQHLKMTKEKAEFIVRDMMSLNTVNKAGPGFGKDAG